MKSRVDLGALGTVLVIVLAALIFSSAAWTADTVADNPLWTKTAWTSWNSWDGNNPGTVVGTITIDKRKITVTYTGEVDFVNLHGRGINYYLPESTFSCQRVPNAPKHNMIAISGTADTHSITFSAPVKNPVMAIVSLGQASIPVDYNFSSHFKILVQGPELYYGGGPNNLTVVKNKTLRGAEGDGLIKFNGQFTSLSWTVGNSEYWNGFTVGVAPTNPQD